MGQKTMDDAEVQKKDDFTLTDTGTCPGMRPKADKKNASYVPSCTDSGVNKFIAVHPMRNLLGNLATTQFPTEACMHNAVSSCSLVSSSGRHGVRFFYMHNGDTFQVCSTIAAP